MDWFCFSEIIGGPHYDNRIPWKDHCIRLLPSCYRRVFFRLLKNDVASRASIRIVRALPPPKNPFMSQHRSLKGVSTIAAKRNVLKRFERVELLKKRGQFKPGDKVIGLRKTKPDA